MIALLVYLLGAYVLTFSAMLGALTQALGRRNTAANPFMVGGGALAVAGGTWWVLL